MDGSSHTSITIRDERERERDGSSHTSITIRDEREREREQ